MIAIRDKDSAGHGGRRCEPRGRQKLRYVDTITKRYQEEWAEERQVLDSEDWRMAVSRVIH